MPPPPPSLARDWFVLGGFGVQLGLFWVLNRVHVALVLVLVGCKRDACVATCVATSRLDRFNPPSSVFDAHQSFATYARNAFFLDAKGLSQPSCLEQFPTCFAPELGQGVSRGFPVERLLKVIGLCSLPTSKHSFNPMEDERRAGAGQGRAGQGRAGQGRAGQGRAGQGRAGQGRAGQGWAGLGRAGQGWAGQGWAGQGWAGLTDLMGKVNAVLHNSLNIEKAQHLLLH